MKSLSLPGRPRPYIMAHRGNRVACPENTLAAFRRALAEDADILETDLHVSHDGAFVCIHDATLDRTTDGRGEVETRTLAELKTFDAGGGRPGFAGERLPTLAEAAGLLPAARVLALGAVAPDIPIGYITLNNPLPLVDATLFGPLWPLLVLNPLYPLLAHARGGVVCPLDPTPDSRLWLYRRLGCDAVLTDDPGTTRKALGR